MSYFRPLLPRQPQGPDNKIVEEIAPERSKRELVTVACDDCRRSKVKCDGHRPVCSRCQKRKRACHYAANSSETSTQALKRKFNEIQSRVTPYEELFHILRTKSEDESIEVLRRLRKGATVESVLKYIHQGDLLLQLSVMPESRRRYSLYFSKDIPLFLARYHGNPYISSLVYEWTAKSEVYVLPNKTSAPTIPRNEVLSYQDPYLKPYSAAEMVDYRIDSLEPSKWTTVSSDNGLMRRLLQLYFQHEHQWFFILHRELFLEDMANNRSRFCSRLLVNALLAYACHCHPGLVSRAEYWNPQNVGYQFLAESKRLWDLERGKLHLTTVQAAMALNFVYNACGADKIGSEFAIQAVHMGRQLGLFRNHHETLNKDQQIAMAFTAWSLFMWTATMALHFCQSPLLEDPPGSDLPDPLTNPEWYGETWLKYPLCQTLFPVHFGYHFRARARFFLIVNDIAKHSFTRTDKASRLSDDQIREYYMQLIRWLGRLEEPLTPQRVVLPAQLKLHMHYHNLIIILLERLASTRAENDTEPLLAGQIDESACQIVYRSRVFLQTLLHLYYLRHSFETVDTFIIQFLSLVAFINTSLLRESNSTPDADDIRSTALLCAKGLYDQGKGFYLARITFQIVQDSLEPKDMEKLKQYIKVEEPLQKEDRIRAEDVQSEYPVNITSIDDKVEDQRLSSLVKPYMELVSDSS